MITGVHHIGLKVQDQASTTWLDHIGVLRGQWMVCPNVYILISSTSSSAIATGKRAVQAPGLAHICLQSRDINEGLAKGVAAGLVPLSGPVDLGTPFRYLYAHTADGILLELEGAPFASDKDPRFWIGHLAFVAIEIEALVDFYGRALNLTPSSVSRFRSNPRINQVAGLDNVDLSAMWLPGLNVGLEFWHYYHPPAPVGAAMPASGFDHMCFECNDFDADCARVISQGAVSTTLADFGLSDCRSAAFRDPEGNCFALIAFNNKDDPMSIANLPHKDHLADVAAQLNAIRQR